MPFPHLPFELSFLLPYHLQQKKQFLVFHPVTASEIDPDADHNACTEEKDFLA